MPITRYLKIAEEKDFAKKADSDNRKTLDPESAEIDPEDDEKLIYEGMSGLDRLVELGPYSTSGDIELPFDDEVAPWFFKWLLGGYEKKHDTHKFFPDRKPTLTSFTAWIGKDIMEHIFLGNVVEEIEIEVEDEWVSMTVSVLGAKDEKGDLDDDVEYDEGKIFAAHAVKIERNDSDMTSKVDSMTLTISNDANVEDAQGPGSRFPQKAYNGELQVELEMGLGFTEKDELVKFWGDSDGPTSHGSVEDFDTTLHIGDDVDITFPRLIYTAAEQPAEGRDHITQTVTARGLVDPDNDNEGPVIVSIENDVSSYDIDDDSDDDSDDSDSDNSDDDDE